MNSRLETDYKTLKPYIFAKMLRKVSNRQTLEDCYNGVFLNLLEDPTEYKSIKHKTAYVYKAVLYAYLNAQTRGFNSLIINEKYRMYLESTGLSYVPPTQFDDIKLRQDFNWFNSAIKTLPKKQRRALLARMKGKPRVGHYESNKTNYRLARLRLTKDYDNFISRASASGPNLT